MFSEEHEYSLTGNPEMSTIAKFEGHTVGLI